MYFKSPFFCTTRNDVTNLTKMENEKKLQILYHLVRPVLEKAWSGAITYNKLRISILFP